MPTVTTPVQLSARDLEVLLDGANRRETALCDMFKASPGPAMTEALMKESKELRELVDRLIAARRTLRELEALSIGVAS